MSRRSLAAGIGIAAVLFLAACSPDQTSQHQPLAPQEPSFAMSDQCAGSLGSTIAKQIKDNFTSAQATDLTNRYQVIKSLCPNAVSQMMSYIDAFIGYHGTLNQPRAEFLASHLANITNYVTGSPVVRPFGVFMATGGADVLSPGESMITFNSGGRLTLDSSTLPAGPHLFTWEMRPASDCDGFTSLRLNGQGNGTGCYQVSDYPHETSYSPRVTITMCLEPAADRALVHNSAFLSGEVLPPVSAPIFDCSIFHASNDSWLRQNGGPLGRVLASAYDYLAPRPLIANDAGTVGSMGDFSLVGGALQTVFQDGFTDIINPPEIGDAWTVQASTPGYIQVVNGEVVLSQAQGNCANCPVFQLLGTRVNGTPTETVGSYDVVWTSRQTKPNIKEAPFVVLNGNGEEIARLSYVSVSNQNRLIFTVQQAGTDSVYDVGAWLQNVNQTFKITVNTTVLGTNDNTVSFEGAGLATISNTPAPFATSLKQIGYVLTGIDAGILVSDNWSVFRKNDVP
jgi:hypothetical protein